MKYTFWAYKMHLLTYLLVFIMHLLNFIMPIIWNENKIVTTFKSFVKLIGEWNVNLVN